jgi:hypothetical protein
MTRFADQLFDDLMQEHGPALAHARMPAAPKRHLAARPAMLAAGAGGLAVAATIGSLVVSGGGTPAYALTKNSDGTVTLAVYKESGIAEANAKLRAYGDDRVVVVPVEAGCLDISSLPAPRVQAKQVSVQASGSGTDITVNAQGVPDGDILVLGVQDSGSGQFQFSMQQTSGSQGSGSETHRDSAADGGTGPVRASGSSGSGPMPGTVTAARLTSGTAPSCVSISGTVSVNGQQTSTVGPSVTSGAGLSPAGDS